MGAANSRPMQDLVMGACMGLYDAPDQEDLINLSLPPELLYQILRLLAPGCLKSAMLVCRLWREVGEDSRLWSWAYVRVTREDLSGLPGGVVIIRTSQMGRMAKVKGFVIEQGVKERGLRHLWQLFFQQNHSFGHLDRFKRRSTFSAQSNK